MYGHYYGFYYDPMYIWVIIAALASMAASMLVNSTFAKYNRVRSMTGLTGAEAAERLLQAAGIHDVRVERVRGNLTDHYDPTRKVLRLSDATYASASVAALGVTAHEVGHALQHQEGYVPLKLRSALVPAANFGSRIGIPLILIGFFLGANSFLVQIGIWVFAIAVSFQIVTLPVEFNASRRAVTLLDERGILRGEEVGYCKKVLGAAALTYVAAAAGSVIQLLRLIMIFGGGRRDD